MGKPFVALVAIPLVLLGCDGSNTADAEKAKQAAGQGHVLVQTTLDSMVVPGEVLPRGMPFGFNDALAAVRSAENEGHTMLQSTLADLPKGNAGRNIPGIGGALGWAQSSAGQAALQGAQSTPLTTTLTRSWWLPQSAAPAPGPAPAIAAAPQKAVSKVETARMFDAGVACATGNGVPQDLVEAAKWYRKAAAQGHPQAEMSLGVLYAIGKGVPQDRAEAYVWLSLASARGVDAAIPLRDEQARGLTPQTLEKAQERARILHDGLQAR